jgi:hypothetical protein
MESQCLIDPTNLIKTKNHFDHFFNIFAFYYHTLTYIFLPQIYFGTSQYTLEKNNSLCYNLPYYAKKLEKYAPILPWLKFKHGHP